MKKFVKEFGGADLYEGLSVKFIAGHNPDLVIFDENGSETKRIDLTKYDNTDTIHNLLKDEGFISKNSENSKNNENSDDNPECVEWAQRGECEKNPKYMMKTCRHSCHNHSNNKKIELR